MEQRKRSPFEEFPRICEHADQQNSLVIEKSAVSHLKL